MSRKTKENWLAKEHMGTRHLTVVQIDGQYRVAQYGQWDGYPEGQGAIVLEFLKNWDRERFTAKVRASQWISDAELKALWKEAGAKDDEPGVTLDVSEKFGKKYPHLSRDCGAKVLGIIEASPDGIKLRDTISFAADSLFCEWAYVIDLDKDVLEVFGGFNKAPIASDERFFGWEEKYPEETPEHQRNPREYWPVKLLARYPLNALPSVEDMNKQCNPE